jgi:glycosyl transferase family 87
VAIRLGRNVSLRVAVGAIVALHVVMLLAPPLLSADVFGYLDFGRLGVLHHLNPYSHAPAAVPGDAAYPFVQWRNEPSLYGPLFTLTSYALAPLGVAASLWAMKLLAAAASLGCVALTYRCAQRLRRPAVPAALLVGTNPILLIYAVGGAHNDLLLMACAAAGIALLVAGRERIGAGAIVAAAGIKASSGLLLPFAIAGSTDRRRMIVASLVALGAIVGVTLLVFGTAPFHAASLLGSQQSLASQHSVPFEVGRVLGLGGVTLGIRIAGLAFAAGVAAVMLRRSAKGADWITAAGWTVLAVLIATTWLMPWYVVWLLPLAALSTDRRLRWATLAFGLFVVVAHLPALSA